MGEHARILASLVFEEIDDQLRRLTQERDDATSALTQDVLDQSIQRRLRERIAWEQVLMEAGNAVVRENPDVRRVLPAPESEQKLAS